MERNSDALSVSFADSLWIFSLMIENHICQIISGIFEMRRKGMRKERDNNDVQTDITAVLPAVLHFCVTIQTSDVGP